MVTLTIAFETGARLDHKGGVSTESTYLPSSILATRAEGLSISKEIKYFLHTSPLFWYAFELQPMNDCKFPSSLEEGEGVAIASRPLGYSRR